MYIVTCVSVLQAAPEVLMLDSHMPLNMSEIRLFSMFQASYPFKRMMHVDYTHAK